MKKSKYLQILASSVASGLSIKDTSEIAGCTESTAYSLSCSDEFRIEVNRLRSEAVERAVSILSHKATKASNAMVKLLDSQDEKIVLAAATKLLSILPPLQNLAELHARVDRIESKASLMIAK